MCGIVGIVNPLSASDIDQMNLSQLHRGPDDSGAYCDRTLGVFLAMRRLSIVDLTSGSQPMTSKCGRFTLVFNGEIVNHRQLRSELQSAGFSFSSDHSDTEVLLNGYVAWGADILKRLNGMFAFVVYDRLDSILFGALDHFGIKPLYLHCNSFTFAFASELKSLKQITGFQNEISQTALSLFLSLQYVPAPFSIQASVSKLQPGHSFTYYISTQTLSIDSYWKPSFSLPAACSYSEVVELGRAQLQKSISLWADCDVPFGLSLSGGLDSSALLGILCASSQHKVNTWSLATEQDLNDLSELRSARKFSQYCGSSHHEVVVKPSMLLDDLPSMIRALDEPYAGSLPCWYIYKAMKGTVKMALTGNGADELFGNYGKWSYQRSFSRSRLRTLFNAIFEDGIYNSLRFSNAVCYSRAIGEVKKSQLYPKSCDYLNTLSLLQAKWDASPSDDVFDATAFIDLAFQLPGEFNLVHDRFSMAHSIESRPPFLDLDLVQFVYSLPSLFRVNTHSYKQLLRDMINPWVPPSFQQTQKRGFTFPLSEWLTTYLLPYVEYFLGSSYVLRQSLFDPLSVSKLVDEFRKDPKLAQQVYTLLMFQLWYENNFSSHA